MVLNTLWVGSGGDVVLGGKLGRMHSYLWPWLLSGGTYV